MRRFPRTVLALGLALSLTLSACGGDDDETSNPQEDTTDQDAPRYGGTLVVAATSDPGPLNPGITTSVPTHVVTGPMFNGLVGIDQSLKATPDLATAWDVAEDGKSVTFELAEGVTWHDGTPFTSADVKFTFEEILLQFSSRTKAALGPVLDGIDTPDAATVVFRFKQPYAAFLALIEKVNAPIMPKHIYEGTDPMTNPANQKPVGTGAFRFEEGVTGDHYTMVRNDSYFKEGQPYLDKIVVRIMPDEASASAAFERGEVDYMLFPPARDVARLAALPGVTRTEKGREAFASVTYFVFNLNRPALKDLRVREAIAAAIDKQFIIDAVQSGEAIATTGPISPELKAFYNPNVNVVAHDVERAKALLAEAKKPSLKLNFVHDPSVAKLATVLKDQLAQAGIELELISLERNAWIDRIYKAKDFDLSYTNFENGPDPDIGVKRAFISSNIAQVPFSNAAGYNNPAVDKLLADAATSADAAARKQLYDEFQEIVSRDLPYLYLHQTQSGVVFRSEFKGLHETSGRSTIYYEDTWSTKGTAQG